MHTITLGKLKDIPGGIGARLHACLYGLIGTSADVFISVGIADSQLKQVSTTTVMPKEDLCLQTSEEGETHEILLVHTA